MTDKQTIKDFIEYAYDQQLKINIKNSAIWAEIAKLKDSELPTELPSDCLVFVSCSLYKQIGLIGYIPDFIKASAYLEDHRIVLVKKQTESNGKMHEVIL